MGYAQGMTDGQTIGKQMRDGVTTAPRMTTGAALVPRRLAGTTGAIRMKGVRQTMQHKRDGTANAHPSRHDLKTTGG